MYTALFVIYALVAVASAIGVLASASVVRMAVCLTTCLGSLSGLFLLFGADFVAAAQLLVYVGGTIILLIFGVMLTASDPANTKVAGPADLLAAGVFALLLGGLLVAVTMQIDWGRPSGTTVAARSTGAIGLAMLGTPSPGTASYLLPFELISVHLLVVLIGAAYLARATRMVRGPEAGDVRDDDDFGVQDAALLAEATP